MKNEKLHLRLDQLEAENKALRESVAVPTGWKIKREGDWISIIQPDKKGVKVRLNISDYRDSAATLYRLADAILICPPAPAADDRVQMALARLLSTSIATDTLHKLDSGQGVNTDDGRAWLAAREIIKAGVDSAADERVREPDVLASVATALPACTGKPTEKGVYFWRDGSSMAAVHVHRRPTASQPGNQLNASVIPGSTFYDGCAVSEWSGQFYGPLPGTGEPKPSSKADGKGGV